MRVAASNRVRSDLEQRGYAVTTSRNLGLPAESDVIAAFAPALVPDPRGPGKQHARDVVRYDSRRIVEAESIAHGEIDDFSRFELTALPIAPRVLRLVPPLQQRASGRLSADYFRYAPGARSDGHQDKFGDLVVIWVLSREGTGGESFLTTLDGASVFRKIIRPGRLLIFRDELFLHGVTALDPDGSRDALIFITLRDN